MTLLVDLDNTLLAHEILVELALFAGVQDAIESLTSRAMRGEEPFRENFNRRISMLRGIPPQSAIELIQTLKFRSGLLDVMRAWPGPVAVVTSNLDCWVRPILSDLDVPFFCSIAELDDLGRPVGVDTLLDKEGVVQGIDGPTIYVGDGANDARAMEVASIGIGFLPNGRVVPPVLKSARYVFTSEELLCRFLSRLSSSTLQDGGNG